MSQPNNVSAAGVLSDEWLERMAGACGLYGVRKAAAAYAREVLAAASAQVTGQTVPEGWKLVPSRMTERMRDEADFAMQSHVGDDYTESDDFDGWYQPVWAAILAAAPSPAAREAGDGVTLTAEQIIALRKASAVLCGTGHHDEAGVISNLLREAGSR